MHLFLDGELPKVPKTVCYDHHVFSIIRIMFLFINRNLRTRNRSHECLLAPIGALRRDAYTAAGFGRAEHER